MSKMIRVDTCSDCKHWDYDFSVQDKFLCTHDKRKSKRIDNLYEKPPSWCPLEDAHEPPKTEQP